MKKVVIIASSVILSLFAIIGLGIGSYRMLKQASEDELVRVVYSDEVKKIIEDDLKNFDSQALTENGLIKSYEIEKESIRHSPMGGIMFDVYVNDDKSLYIYFDIDRDSRTNRLINYGGGNSAKFEELIKENDANG